MAPLPLVPMAPPMPQNAPPHGQHATRPHPPTEAIPIPPAPIEARLLEMVFPDHTNHLGTLFGGQALAWMDKAAFIVASRYARRTVVTARSEEVNFRVPVRTGQLVELVASVVKVGRSSMHVEVEMTAEDPLSGDRRVCTTGRFVMIALDSNGSPTAIPALPDAAG
jgi:acyl-CoA hydrolase